MIKFENNDVDDMTLLQKKLKDIDSQMQKLAQEKKNIQEKINNRDLFFLLSKEEMAPDGCFCEMDDNSFCFIDDQTRIHRLYPKDDSRGSDAEHTPSFKVSAIYNSLFELIEEKQTNKDRD